MTATMARPRRPSSVGIREPSRWPIKRTHHSRSFPVAQPPPAGSPNVAQPPPAWVSCVSGGEPPRPRHRPAEAVGKSLAGEPHPSSPRPARRSASPLRRSIAAARRRGRPAGRPRTGPVLEQLGRTADGRGDRRADRRPSLRQSPARTARAACSHERRRPATATPRPGRTSGR